MSGTDVGVQFNEEDIDSILQRRSTKVIRGLGFGVKGLNLATFLTPI